MLFIVCLWFVLKKTKTNCAFVAVFIICMKNMEMTVLVYFISDLQWHKNRNDYVFLISNDFHSKITGMTKFFFFNDLDIIKVRLEELEPAPPVWAWWYPSRQKLKKTIFSVVVQWKSLRIQWRNISVCLLLMKI